MFDYFKRGWSDFWKGLTIPSMTAVVVALLVPVLFVFSAILIGPRLLTGDSYKFFMVDSYDRHTLVSHRILSGVPSDRPTAAILGASTMIFCVNEALDLDGLASAKTGKKYNVLNLATPDQSTVEMAAILAELDFPPDSVVIVGLSVNMFRKPIADVDDSVVAEALKHPRFAFHSEVLEDEAGLFDIDVPVHSDIYALANAKFFLSRKKEILINLLRGGREPADPLTEYWVDIVDNDEFRAKEKAQIEIMAEGYQKSKAQNFAVLQRMMDRESARSGTSFILTQAPINPGWYGIPAGKALFETFKKDLRDFAEVSDAAYFSIQDHTTFEEGEFLDFEGHLRNDEARLKCSDAIAASLSGAQGRS